MAYIRTKATMEEFATKDQANYYSRIISITIDGKRAYELKEEEHEEEKRCNDITHERPICKIKRFEMIKYSFGEDEKYVAIKENEYDDLTSTYEDACRAYHEIFCSMDKGWVVTREDSKDMAYSLYDTAYSTELTRIDTVTPPKMCVAAEYRTWLCSGGGVNSGGVGVGGSGEKGGQRRRCSGVHSRVAVVAGVVLWRVRESGVEDRIDRDQSLRTSGPK
uniref:Uncharacterized protein n=1 Tax=Tanacetum cinerariifolium TaxID=118510 RepID=A0A6L2LKE6_TANCI|nr:hypothetical protein [Tanacetum cinerariifolium]